MEEETRIDDLISKTRDGHYRLPALIDAHVHIESSHLVPSNFGRLLARNGTLVAICDPHEIVNVMGVDGLEFMLADAANSPTELRFALPSCVPSTPFETSGATLTSADTRELFSRHPELIALGEMMNVPGVLAGDPEVLAKLDAARRANKRIDGHFPGGCGEKLRTYVAAGISSDHESVSADEAREKIAAGMTVFIREGSAAKNLEAVLPAVDNDNWRNFCFCTDDISAHDLLKNGGIINCIRKAVKMGLDPVRAVAMASANPARHYGIPLRAGDGVIVRDLVDFEIIEVLKDGRPLSWNHAGPSTPPTPNTVHLPDLATQAFTPPPPHDGLCDVIGVKADSLITDHLRLDPHAAAKLPLLTVIERHGRNGNISSAPVAGTGLRQGAIASTVAHDHHNLIVLGENDADIRCAADRLARLGGGLCAVKDGRILAELPLPVAGLMSAASPETVAESFAQVVSAAKETGCTLPDPFATLSFLALPVVPALKLTDKGLFDCSL